MFDPPERNPYANLPVSVVNCEKHRQIARQAARASVVLLKNDKGLLPLSKDLNNIMIIGPNGMSMEAMLGCYNGYNPRIVTVMEGIMEKIGFATEAKCKIGCDITGESDQGFDYSLLGWQNADALVAVLGLDPTLEGEQGAAIRAKLKSDRTSLELPGAQKALLKRMCRTGKPVVVLIMAGSQLDLAYAKEHADALLIGWYPGMEGGNALADVLFGDYNPAGRLPITYPKSLKDLPPFKDYRLKGRTYRYSKKEPLFPFGYGLSYTTFEYSRLKLSKKKVTTGTSIKVSVQVTNTGDRPGDEVVQLYLSRKKASVTLPVWSLAGFKRIHLGAGDTFIVTFTLSPEELAYFNHKGEWVLDAGSYTVFVGGQQPDKLSEKLTGHKVLSARFTLTGRKQLLEF
jgi:beta-glucosidase